MEPPILRTSERTAFRRCPQRWWWAYRDGLKSKLKPADALWFGIGVHEALAEWYQDGFDRGQIPSKTFEEWAGEEVRWIKANYAERERDWFEEPLYEEATELGVAMLDAYLEEYDDDPHLEILAIEQPFEIELTDWEQNILAVFKSRFDGVAIDHNRNEMVLLEHKTAGSIKTAHLPLDDQAGAYFAVATIVLRDQGIIGSKDTIDYIMYNFLRKSKPDQRERNSGGAYLNKDGNVSKRQPPAAFLREYVDRSPREVNQQLRRIVEEVEIMNEMRYGTLPVTKSVTDMCPYCPFFQMCKLHEKGGRAWMDFRDAQFTVENPYEDMRKSAAT